MRARFILIFLTFCSLQLNSQEDPLTSDALVDQANSSSTAEEPLENGVDGESAPSESSVAEQTQGDRTTGGVGVLESSAEDVIDDDPLAGLDFIQRMERQDILTMDYYALRSELESLELNTSGNLESLRQRLLQHFNFPPRMDGTDPGRIITIKSARETEYFVLEETEEGYIRLTGGVELHLRDDEEDVTHKIIADQILFNKDAESVTALGNVFYTMDKSDSDETFTGSSLTFNISNWSGAFFQGTSTRDRQVDSANLTFSFSGSTIERNTDDVIVLDDGTITSSQTPNPFYRIRAQKIWILAPGEWGLVNAILYVGRVPIFYFPFFFQPGDDMVFNPVLSIDPEDWRGNYIQTTTYIMGRKESSDSPLSFMQIADPEDENSPLALRGLHLVKAEDESEHYQGEYPENYRLKFLFDSYTQLGFFSGIDLSFPGFLDFTKFDGKFGIGATFTQRVSGETNDDVELDLFPWEQGDYNTTDFYGFEIPFRFGFDVDLEYSGYGLSVDFYSDPFVTSDFWTNRSEDFSIFYIAGLGDQEPITTRDTTGTTALNWLLGFPRFSVPKDFLPPVISNINISSVNLGLSWTTVNLPIDAVDADSPMKSFYIPNLLSSPNYRADISGDFLSFLGTGGEDIDFNLEQTPLVLPWTPNEELQAVIEELEVTEESGELLPESQELPLPEFQSSEEKTVLQIPDILDNLSITGSQNLVFDFKAPYSLNTSGKINTQFLSANSILPEQYEPETDFSLWNFNYRGQLTPQFNFSSRTFFFETNTSFNGNFQKTFNYNSEDEESFRGSDAGINQFSLNQQFNVSAKPLFFFPQFSTSNINYTLKLLLFDWEQSLLTDPLREEDTFTGPDWNEERVNNHFFKTTLTFAPFVPQNALFNLNANYSTGLEPNITNQDFSISATSSIYGINSSLTTSAKALEDEDWDWNSITGNISYQFSDWLSVSERLEYGINEEEFLTSESKLQLGPLTTTFIARRQLPFNYDIIGGWTQGTEEGFYPSDLNLTLPINIIDFGLFQDRVQIDFTSNTTLALILQRFTGSYLNMNFNLNVSIDEDTTFTFSSTHQNQAVYLYFPYFADILDESGVLWINPLDDIAKSFNFFNFEDRQSSKFNLYSINLSFKQKFEDWDLTFQYNGSPQKVEEENDQSQWKWLSNFTLGVAWKPIPEIKADIEWDEKTEILDISTDADS